MNSLSWTIYAIQLLDSFDTFLGWLTAFFFITGFVAFAFRILSGDAKDPEITHYHNKCMRYVKWAIPCGFIVAFFNVLTPDRNTMLLIAASQIGERVVSSQTVQSVVDPSVDLLRTWIEEQTRTLRRASEGNNRR